MNTQTKTPRGRGAAAADAATCSADVVLEWAWAEACTLTRYGEDPADLSLGEVKRRFCRDLAASPDNVMVVIDPRCTRVDTDKLGPFVQRSDGSLLTVGDNQTFVSGDGGMTWSNLSRMCRETVVSRPGAGGVLARTGRGHLVYAYLDMRNLRFSWDEERKEAGKDTRLDVWTIRSEDEGRTWQDRKRVFAGYCGALINMIEATDGTLVLPIQRLIRNPSRHGISVYVSGDGGKSWSASPDVLDLGGHGDHDGAIEPTIVQLKDGRIWMLMRTNLDQFWSATSDDYGRTWPVLRPSDIDASSAPGAMIRLASGRLALAWNRLCAEGRKNWPRWGGDERWSLRPASAHREELSIAFSEDDGKTWSTPQVIIRHKDNGACYPYLFELEPGMLWVSTMLGCRTALMLVERDFVGRSTR